MEIVKLLLERLLAWPFATVVIFLFFKKPIIALLDRVIALKAGRDGFALDAPIAAVTVQAEAKIQTGLPDEAEQRLRQVKSLAISPSVQLREDWIRADIEKMRLEPNKETVDLLIRQLAAMQATATAERLYRTIFGSQIALLRILNVRRAAARADLEAVYDVAKSLFPKLYDTYSLDQWLGYLQTNGLIAPVEGGQFSISTDGRELLKWITEVGLSEDKPF